MKFFKKLATVCMAITLCFGFGAALTACDGNAAESSSSSEETVEKTDYEFEVVKENGDAAVGYEIQLCIKKDGVLQGCLPNNAVVDEDGKAVFPSVDKSNIYEIHVYKDKNTQLKSIEFQISGIQDIPANYDGGVIKITVLK